VTAQPGYVRARTSRQRVIDELWLALRRSPSPISAAELADQVGASRTITKRLIQAARDAAWVIVDGYEQRAIGQGPSPALYRVTRAAPVRAPILRDGDQGPEAIHEGERGGATSGAVLAALRRARGWTIAQTAEAIGIRDHRTVRRYEAAAALPPAVAERVEALRAGAALPVSPSS